MERLTIKDFIITYNIGYSYESIAYHMKTDKIDWDQPGRDKFVILTDKTKQFYNL